MSRVRYRKNLRDLERGDDAFDQDLPHRVRMIRCVYETDAEVAEAVVPKPLEASVGAEVSVSFTSIETPIAPDVTVESRYATFGVRVDYDSSPGNYLLTEPTTSEARVLLGRERFGLPAKLAEISFASASGGEVDRVEAQVTRKGVRYLLASARRVEDLGPRKFVEHGYCFKAFAGCTAGKGFDQDPQLVRLDCHHDFSQVWRLEGEIELADSPFDPVSDLPVRRIIEFEYAEGTLKRVGRVLRPVPGDWLLPFLHQRYDEPDVLGVEI